MSIKLVLVAAVALVDGGRVLMAQRPPGKPMAGLWEFPGGKVEPGETPEAALVRELAEELGITVDPGALEPLTFASHPYEKFHLLMPVYACHEWTGALTGREGQAFDWFAADALKDLPMPAADLPLIAPLAAYLKSRKPG
jgi:8-oxo-dGTP diphosphatase